MAPSTPDVRRATKFESRSKWITAYILSHGRVDVLCLDFVESFAEATGCKYVPAPWGAGWCDTLGRTLSRMEKLGRLKRKRLGLGSNWQSGFPKWVWTYSL